MNPLHGTQLEAIYQLVANRAALFVYELADKMSVLADLALIARAESPTGIHIAALEIIINMVKGHEIVEENLTISKLEETKEALEDFACKVDLAISDGDIVPGWKPKLEVGD